MSTKNADNILNSQQPLRKPEEEIRTIAKLVAEGYDDDELRGTFLGLALQLYVLMNACEYIPLMPH